MSILLILAAVASAPPMRSLKDFFGACNAIARTAAEYDFCGDGFADAKKKNENDRRVEKCFTDNLSQDGMDMCADMSFKLEDKKLNEQWAATVDAMKRLDKDTPHNPEVRAFDELLKAQRAWLVYRDATCRAIGAETSGGSITPMNVMLCLASMDHLRTKELFDISRNPNNPDEPL